MSVSKTSVTTHKVDYAQRANLMTQHLRVHFGLLERSGSFPTRWEFIHIKKSYFSAPRRGEMRDFYEFLLRTSLNTTHEHQSCPAPRFRVFV